MVSSKTSTFRLLATPELYQNHCPGDTDSIARTCRQGGPLCEVHILMESVCLLSLKHLQCEGFHNVFQRLVHPYFLNMQGILYLGLLQCDYQHYCSSREILNSTLSKHLKGVLSAETN